MPYFFVFICLGLYIASSGYAAFTNRSLRADRIVEETNKVRIQIGLPPLKLDARLTEAAAEKSLNMAQDKYFAHESPGGVTPWHWIKAVNYSYSYAGENLAINFSDPTRLVQAWLQSPEHKENLLNPLYKDVGVAVRELTVGKKNYTLIVQFFAAPQTVSYNQ